MKELVNPNDRRMTVREVAEALGVSPETVRANGKSLYPDLFINGVTTYLNEEQVTAIKLKIQGHHNLQSTLEVRNAKTDLEKALLIKQAMQFQQEIIENLQRENEELKPKAALADRAMLSEDTLSINDAAKVLKLGYANVTFFKRLRELKIFITGDVVPYQRYIARGYFVVDEEPVLIGDNIRITKVTKVTQKGMEWLSRLADRGLLAREPEAASRPATAPNSPAKPGSLSEEFKRHIAARNAETPLFDDDNYFPF